MIAELAQHFGWPRFDVIFDAEGQTIAGLDVRRGAPVGRPVTPRAITPGRVVGLPRDEAVPASGLVCLHFPCLASMRLERNGEEIDTILHNAGKVLNDAMAAALERRAHHAEPRKAA